MKIKVLRIPYTFAFSDRKFWNCLFSQKEYHMVYNSLKCVSFSIYRAVLGQLYLWISTLTIATGRHCAHCYPENHALM